MEKHGYYKIIASFNPILRHLYSNIVWNYSIGQKFCYFQDFISVVEKESQNWNEKICTENMLI